MRRLYQRKITITNAEEESIINSWILDMANKGYQAVKINGFITTFVAYENREYRVNPQYTQWMDDLDARQKGLWAYIGLSLLVTIAHI